MRFKNSVMNLVKKMSLLFLLPVIMYSCYRDNASSLYPASASPGSIGCDTSDVSFTGSIQPILTQNCVLASCHASSSASGGYILDNFYGVQSIVLSGRFIGAITHAAGYSPMPKNSPKLSDCQLGLIISWVNQGAQNN